MEVTRANFPAVLDDFCELIRSCEFFAFDEEMTGINLAGVEENPLASIQDRYHAKKLVAERYSIIQIGVCLFHRDHSEKKGMRYIARPFNFFLFPTSVEENGFSPQSAARSDVVLSSSAIAFLRKHNMDFQRWVYHGVPYCNEPTELMIRKQYEDAETIRSAGPKLNKEMLSQSDALWFETCLAAAQRFSEASSGPSELMMAPCKNRAAHTMLRHEVEQLHRNLLVAFRGRNQAKDVILQRVSVEERAQKEKWDKSLREQELLDKVGFRRAFLAMIESKKPCVGHNSLADILFLLSALDRPLPELVSDFRKRLRELFPIVYDTKFIANDISVFPSGRFPNTHLGGLYETFASPRLGSGDITVMLPLGFQAYSTKTLLTVSASGKHQRGLVAHEAGFDALMTGTVLLHLLKEAGLSITHPAAVQKYGNKVAVFRSIFAFDGDSNDHNCEFSLARGPILIASHNAPLASSDFEAVVGTICGSAGATGLPQPASLSVMTLTQASTAIVPMFAPVTDTEMETLRHELLKKASSISLLESVKFEIRKAGISVAVPPLDTTPALPMPGVTSRRSVRDMFHAIASALCRSW